MLGRVIKVLLPWKDLLLEVELRPEVNIIGSAIYGIKGKSINRRELEGFGFKGIRCWHKVV